MLTFVLGLSFGTCLGVVIMGLVRSAQRPPRWHEPAVAFAGGRRPKLDTLA